MADVGGTPKDFGLRVKSHPDGLLVTAPAKMRHGKKMRLSFSDTISEAIIFHRDEKIIDSNFRLVEQYVRQFDATSKPERQKSGTLLWRDVDASDVVAFLETFITHDDARKAQAKLLATYIRSRVADEELVDWTVALISNTSRQRLQDIAGHKLGLIKRTNLADESESRYVIRRLLSPSDEAVDLSKAQFDVALQQTKAAREAGAKRSKSDEPPSVPSGPQIRLQRSPRSGLLLLYPLDPTEAHEPSSSLPIIGLAVSFPKSPGAAEIEYVVTNTYWDQEMGAE